jgi:hypothetical protein
VLCPWGQARPLTSPPSHTGCGQQETAGDRGLLFPGLRACCPDPCCLLPGCPEGAAVTHGDSQLGTDPQRPRPCPCLVPRPPSALTRALPAPPEPVPFVLVSLRDPCPLSAPFLVGLTPDVLESTLGPGCPPSQPSAHPRHGCILFREIKNVRSAIWGFGCGVGRHSQEPPGVLGQEAGSPHS